MAAGFANHSVVEQLLRAKANPDPPDDGQGYFPLLSACCAGSLESVKLLLDGGARPQRCSPGGRTAAQAARTAGHEDCALSIEGHVQCTARSHAAAGEKQDVATRELAEAAQGGSLAALEESISRYGGDASTEILFRATAARDQLRRQSTDNAEAALTAAHASAAAELEKLKTLNEAGAGEAATATDEADTSLQTLRRAISALAEQPEPTGSGAERLREARALRDRLVDEVAKGAKRKKLQQKKEQRRRKEEAAATEVAEAEAMETAMEQARLEAAVRRRADEQQKASTDAIAATEATAVAEAAAAAEAVAAVAAVAVAERVAVAAAVEKVAVAATVAMAAAAAKLPAAEPPAARKGRSARVRPVEENWHQWMRTMEENEQLWQALADTATPGKPTFSRGLQGRPSEHELEVQMQLRAHQAEVQELQQEQQTQSATIEQVLQQKAERGEITAEVPCIT